jgi:hypothetical protein
MALAYTVRDRLLHHWVQTLNTITEDTKVVSYLSAEFLLGPSWATTSSIWVSGSRSGRRYLDMDSN